MLNTLSQRLTESRWRLVLGGGAVAGALFYLSYWAGVPKTGFTPFVIGIAVLVGLALVYGAIAWHLLIRPLPAGVKAPGLAMLPAAYRRLLAVLMMMSSVFLTLGGFWDEVWHRKFGLPFGEDLLWRPHLLIYFSFMIPPALAALSLYLVFTRGQGSLQQRLRADPVLSFLVLMGGFLMYNVPADPLWHTIYGEDISAWSLPHLLLSFCALMMALLGAFIQLTTVEEKKEWTSVFGLRPAVAFVLVFLASATSVLLQVLITDFENASPMAMARPIWLLPTIITGVMLLMGTLANQATRSYGAATIVGLLVVGVRFALIQAFNFPQLSGMTWLAILPPLVVLDGWYAYRALSSRASASAIATGGVALVGVSVSLWLITRFYDYLHYDVASVIVTLVMCLLVGTVASWLGALMGDYLGQMNKQTDATVTTENTKLVWLAPALFTASVVFIIFFVATASPPTHTF